MQTTTDCCCFSVCHCSQCLTLQQQLLPTVPTLSLQHCAIAVLTVTLALSWLLCKAFWFQLLLPLVIFIFLTPLLVVQQQFLHCLLQCYYHCLACAITFAATLVLALSQEVDCCTFYLSFCHCHQCHCSLAEAVMIVIVLWAAIWLLFCRISCYFYHRSLLLLTAHQHTPLPMLVQWCHDVVAISPAALCDSCFSSHSCGCSHCNAAAWCCSCLCCCCSWCCCHSTISSPLVDCHIFIVFPFVVLEVLSLYLIVIVVCHCHCWILNHCCCQCHDYHCCSPCQWFCCCGSNLFLWLGGSWAGAAMHIPCMWDNHCSAMNRIACA